MNKLLIILGASNDQIPAYQKARELGIRTLGVDYNPNSPAFKYCDIPLVVSVKHEDQLIPALERVAESFDFIGVMTLGVEISPMVSKVANRFGLTAVDEATAHVTTNKCLRSMRLEECGIPIPKFQIIKDQSNIKLPMPFVIKPSDSSASRGVRRIDYESDLTQAFNEAKEFSTDGRVLIEELLVGDEISIEGFMVNGTMYVTGFADRNYTTIPNTVSQPYFIENGSQTPTCLGTELYCQAKDVFERGALACGITDGPSKGDLIIVDGKVIVIEITSRLSGGGFCSRIQPLANGTDIITATIQWHCGMDVDTELLIPKYCNAVVHRFYMHEPGTIDTIKGLDSLMQQPGVELCIKQYNFKVGTVLEQLNYINRLFYIITKDNDADTALQMAIDALDSVEIKTLDK